MTIPDDSPLLDSRWVRDVGNAVYERLLGNEAIKADKIDADRHRELVQINKDGWKSVAEAISGGLKLIAEAIRDSNRR